MKPHIFAGDQRDQMPHNSINKKYICAGMEGCGSKK
jgi:hypothetical protein